MSPSEEMPKRPVAGRTAVNVDLYRSEGDLNATRPVSGGSASHRKLSVRSVEMASSAGYRERVNHTHMRHCVELPRTPPASHDVAVKREPEAPPTPPALGDDRINPILISTTAEPLPTPAPSPRPRPLPWLDDLDPFTFGTSTNAPLHTFISHMTSNFARLDAASRRAVISALLPVFSAGDLLHTSQLICPLLKRDFLSDLPAEISLHILSFVGDARDLVRASQVCKSWRKLVGDEQTWKEMCKRHRFAPGIPRPGSFFSSREASPAVSGYAAHATSERLPNAEEVLVDASHADLQSQAQTLSWNLQGLGIGTQTSESTISARFATPSPIPVPSTSISSPNMPLARSGTPSASLLQQSHCQPALPSASGSSSVPLSPSFSAANPVAQDQLAGQGPSKLPILLSEERPVTDNTSFSYKTHFKKAYLTESNWLRGPGRLLSTQASNDEGVVTSLGFDSQWIIVGMATSKVHVFDAESGAFTRTLSGHDLGVWCLTLVSRGGSRVGSQDRNLGIDDRLSPWVGIDELAASPAPGIAANGAKGKARASEVATGTGSPSSPFGGPRSLPATLTSPRRRLPRKFSVHPSPAQEHGSPLSTPSEALPAWATGLGAGDAQQATLCGTARGWGQPEAIVVSGGCDRDVRVWDVATGICLFVLRGHTSTIRCLKVLDGRPVAVSGSRDATLRVWDIEQGLQVHVLIGHQHSVRCMEVHGNKVVSGSYDTTCRLWDVDTGECLFVFRGHFHQIYAVAFDGQRVATGSLDSTVRIWSARTGDCLALLQGHTSLVGQLQLTDSVLVTGGSDGRVIVFSLSTLECVHRLCAHDNSVTCISWTPKFLVTGGNDGRVKLFNSVTGAFIRLLTPPCEAVWRVLITQHRCLVLCKRDGRTVMDLIDFSYARNLYAGYSD